MDKIIETLDSIGINSLFMLCSASVTALQTVFSNSMYDYCKMGDMSAFQRGHLSRALVTKTATINCIQSSSLQGYDGVHKLWEDIIN
jgi:hypothetical protein